MTADSIAPGPARVGSASRAPRPARPPARAPREPPKSRLGDRHDRRRPGGRPRHADAVGDAQGAPPAVRPADARVRARRLGEHRRRRRPAAGPIVVYSPPVDGDHDVFADRADVRPPGRAARDRRRGARGDGARSPTTRPRSSCCRGDVPLVTGADLDADPRGAPRGRRGDRPGERLRRRPGRPRPGRPRRVRDGRADRRGARTRRPRSSPATRSNAGLYAFDAAWLRRRIGPSTPSPATGELYLTELVRLAREDGRLVSAVAFEDDGRFDGINDRRSWPRPSGACASGSTRRTCATA